MTIRYRNRLTREHVGTRVVVRRWVEDDERGLVPTDVLGILERWSNDGVLEVRTRHGDLVEVHERHILAAKTLPDPPGGKPPRDQKRWAEEGGSSRARQDRSES